MGLPSLEEDCSSDVREAAEGGGGCGGGEAVAEEDGVRLSAVGDDLGGEELMEDGCRNGWKIVIRSVSRIGSYGSHLCSDVEKRW